MATKHSDAMTAHPDAMVDGSRSSSVKSELSTLALTPAWIALGALAGLAAAVIRGRLSRESPSSEDGRRVSDVMVTSVQAIGPDATLVEAAQRMRQENVGVLPIVENGRVIGVITDRDLVVRALARDGLDMARLRVMECASRDPVLANPGWKLERALLVMAEQQIGRLPVVDDDGQLVGLLTLSSVALRSPKGDATLVAAKKISSRSARAQAA